MWQTAGEPKRSEGIRDEEEEGDREQRRPKIDRRGLAQGPADEIQPRIVGCLQCAVSAQCIDRDELIPRSVETRRMFAVGRRVECRRHWLRCRRWNAEHAETVKRSRR